MLSKLSRKNQSYSRLDLSRRKSSLGVVLAQFACLGGDALEQVVQEGVHDRHGLLGDARVWMDLLQHFVDVDGVGLHSLGGPLRGARLGCCFLGRGFGWWKVRVYLMGGLGTSTTFNRILVFSLLRRMI